MSGLSSIYRIKGLYISDPSKNYARNMGRKEGFNLQREGMANFTKIKCAVMNNKKNGVTNWYEASPYLHHKNHMMWIHQLPCIYLLMSWIISTNSFDVLSWSFASPNRRNMYQENTLNNSCATFCGCIVIGNKKQNCSGNLFLKRKWAVSTRGLIGLQ